MSVILLRTLTKKSLIADGKNKGLLVGDVLIKCKTDLLYSYFNYANLSFTEDILDELRISAEDRITKPGKDPDKFIHYRNRNLYTAAKIVGKTKDHVGTLSVMTKRRKAKAKANLVAYTKRSSLAFSKSAMQRFNHGH
jgi:hypothetical protein